MSILQIPVDNPAELLDTAFLGAGALGRWERSATGGGAGYAEIGTFALVATQRLYTIYDPSGVVGSWYRVRYSKSDGSSPTPYSTEWQAGPDIGAYASLALFRAFVRNQASAADDLDGDVELVALEAAARAIDSHCGRDFHVMADTATTRLYTAELDTRPVGWPVYGPRWWVPTDDFSDATTVEVAFDASGNGDYSTTTTLFRALPANAPAVFRPYRALVFDLGVQPPLHADGVQVKARWGWATTPAAVINANLVQAARFLKRRDSPYGVAGSPEMGNEMRLLSALDPDVALLLKAYRLDWGTA